MKPLPDMPFVIRLSSLEDWQALVSTYPELNIQSQPGGRYLYFERYMGLMWSDELAEDSKDWPLVEFP